MSASQEGLQQISRSTSHWYSDGSIVLEVESTQFRLHKSLLAKDFPIFADTFCFTGPREIEDVEGCPVVRVVGDTVIDWENILIAVYNPYWSYQSPTGYPIPIILSTLRLSVKYGANHLRDMAATCLKNLLPTTLAGWRETGLPDLIYRPSRPPPIFIEHIFEIVDVALELGFQSILPTACLICLQFMGLRKILEGHTRTDGTTSSVRPSTCRTLVLGWQDMLVFAMPHIITNPMSLRIEPNCKGHHWVEQWIDDGNGDEHDDGEYIECDPEKRQSCFKDSIEALTNNPANAFSASTSTFDYELCIICLGPIEEEYTNGRRKVWDRLPTFFGLPAWGELKDFES